ncbi:hypothetical protein F4861DRAFT_535928 [Xylaria intraflava]|nr:hypothetical protein F4861DRAFT_535928 [Xylaria intraflava]
MTHQIAKSGDIWEIPDSESEGEAPPGPAARPRLVDYSSSSSAPSSPELGTPIRPQGQPPSGGGSATTGLTPRVAGLGGAGPITQYTRPDGLVIPVTPVPLPTLPGRSPGAPAVPSTGGAATEHASHPSKLPGNGTFRETPCLGCVFSALAGCSTGKCENAVTGNRCVRCSDGHQCKPLPVEAGRAARALRDAREAGREDLSVRDLRITIRVLLEFAGVRPVRKGQRLEGLGPWGEHDFEEEEKEEEEEEEEEKEQENAEEEGDDAESWHGID